MSNTAILADGTSKSWVDDFAGKWQDRRTTAQIIDSIHKARTDNSN